MNGKHSGRMHSIERNAPATHTATPAGAMTKAEYSSTSIERIHDGRNPSMEYVPAQICEDADSIRFPRTFMAELEYWVLQVSGEVAVGPDGARAARRGAPSLARIWSELSMG